MEFGDIFKDKLHNMDTEGRSEKAIQNIIESFNKNPREIKLLFYYPSDEYVAFLMRVEEMTFFDEIDCTDLFNEETSRNRIIIFQI